MSQTPASRSKSRPETAPAPSSGPSSRRFSRAGWLALAFLSGGIYALFYFQPGLLWYVGVQHYDGWYADLFAILASNDAVVRGLDPYVSNPLDVFGRPHVYSHWWLQLRHLGLTREDIVWLGPAVVVSFWLAAGWSLRPRTRGDFLYALALLASSPFLLALDRANNDLVLFLLLVPLAPCLLHRTPAVRLLAPLLVALAAGLKYFPAAAGLTLLAAAPGKELRIRLALAAALLAAVGFSVAPDLAIFGPLAPKPSGWLSFGAVNLPVTLGWNGPGPAWTCLAAGASVAALAWRSRRLEGWNPAPGPAGDWLRFVTGAALLTGCFFTSANFAYRWVFAVWLAPFLWSTARDAAAPARARDLARLTQGLLLLALWLDTVFTWIVIAARGRFSPDALRAWIKWSFVAEQPVTWALFGCLILFLVHFAKTELRQLGLPGFQPRMDPKARQ